MKTVSKTDIGLVRSSNQDACGCGLLADGAWVVVCDGMGGANGGNVASSMALSCFEEQIRREYQPGASDEEVRRLLVTTADMANVRIYRAALQDPELSGMGTTLVAILVSGGKAHIVHAGDSRAYKISRSGVKQLTVDHSMVQEMLNRGDITREEAVHHPHKNIITGLWESWIWWMWIIPSWILAPERPCWPVPTASVIMFMQSRCTSALRPIGARSWQTPWCRRL